MRWTSKILCLLIALGCTSFMEAQDKAETWKADSPRAEIRPEFSGSEEGGRSGSGSLVIETDARQGLHGHWTRTFSVEGGKHYRFDAWRKQTGVTTPRRSIVVRVIWQSEHGKSVPNENTMSTHSPKGMAAVSRPEHPLDCEVDAQGWTHVSDVYRAPSAATQTVVELNLMWAANSRVEWSDVSLTPVAPPTGRKVRLATVHYQPKSGSTNAEKCHQFAPLIRKAGEQNADMVVLPETLTYYASGRDVGDVAEPIPGESTEYFGKLAKEHNLYIVAGLHEREEHLVYNTAVLIGPDGNLVGKYRKVCLPREEIELGICAGKDYPVFDTRFGKVGLMICYDGFFPEVARELAIRGAEVIAWPVWGCNPDLAKARAVENSVYVVSSTYTDQSREWIHSAVYGHDGTKLAWAKDWGSIGIAEVDLTTRIHWNSIGDFKASLQRHRPERIAETEN